MDITKKYVYQGIEVVLTCRTATRSVNTGRGGVKQDTLYEIQPADIENGKWTKWVRDSDLYAINEK